MKFKCSIFNACLNVLYCFEEADSMLLLDPAGPIKNGLKTRILGPFHRIYLVSLRFRYQRISRTIFQLSRRGQHPSIPGTLNIRPDSWARSAKKWVPYKLQDVPAPPSCVSTLPSFSTCMLSAEAGVDATHTKHTQGISGLKLKYGPTMHNLCMGTQRHQTEQDIEKDNCRTNMIESGPGATAIMSRPGSNGLFHHFFFHTNKASYTLAYSNACPLIVWDFWHN